jgi:hypothetical protein
MTQKQIIKEFEKFSKAEKTAIICQLLQIFEKDLSDETKNTNNKKRFTVEAVRLNPVRDFDFDNIGKLIEEIEGEFHK